MKFLIDTFCYIAVILGAPVVFIACLIIAAFTILKFVCNDWPRLFFNFVYELKNDVSN